jgi:uncharacterized protein DUF4864
MKTVAALWLGLAAALGMAIPARAQQDADAKAAADSILRQLEAFRRDDYDGAYAFASDDIQQAFDRVSFERMVRSGYPEIAHSSSAAVSRVDVAQDGHVHIRMKVKGTNGNTVEALYDMVREGAGWRVNGVVTRPDPGQAV